MEAKNGECVASRVSGSRSRLRAGSGPLSGPRSRARGADPRTQAAPARAPELLFLGADGADGAGDGGVAGVVVVLDAAVDRDDLPLDERAVLRHLALVMAAAGDPVDDLLVDR